MSKERDFVETVIRQLAEETQLTEGLLGIFARILSRQIIIDEESKEVHYGTAFDQLLPIFTFVASDSGTRPTSPFGYEGRVAQAKEAAEDWLFPDSPPDSPFNIIQLQENAIDPLWIGTSDKRDFFVVPTQSDPNGAFATFGAAVIENYQQEEGDALFFMDQNDTWSSVTDFVAEVQPGNGNATILFNNDPAVIDPDQTQSLRIEGAATRAPFANRVSDITDVTMEVITEQAVLEAGGIESYLDLWALG